MGRPPKKPEERRQLATLRLDPEVHRKLEEAAASAENSRPAELEARLVATCDLDRNGVELVQAIAKEIAQIQKMTGKRWHKDLKTWATVAEMLRVGPIHEFNPDLPQNDEDVIAAFEMLEILEQDRSNLIEQLGEMGIAARQDPDKPVSAEAGLATLPDPPRSTARRMCEKLDDPEESAVAASLLDKIIQIDGQCREVSAKFKGALRLHLEAANAGRKLYRDYLRKGAEQKRSRGEPYDIFHIIGVDP